MAHPSQISKLNDAYNTHAAGQTAPPTVNPSCFGTLESAVLKANIAAGRVEQIIARLCGNEPTPEPHNPDVRLGQTLFEAVEDHAMQVYAATSRVNAALDRLEKSLP